MHHKKRQRLIKTHMQRSSQRAAKSSQRTSYFNNPEAASPACPLEAITLIQLVVGLTARSDFHRATWQLAHLGKLACLTCGSCD